jgi:hypothetical protein
MEPMMRKRIDFVTRDGGTDPRWHDDGGIARRQPRFDFEIGEWNTHVKRLRRK